MRKPSSFEQQSVAAEAISSFYDDVTNVSNNIAEVVSLNTNISTIIAIGDDLAGDNYIGLIGADLDLGVDGKIYIVSTDIDKVTVVADNMSNVNAVGYDLSNTFYTQAVGTDLLGDNNVSLVAAGIDEVIVIAPYISDVTIVATDIVDVSTIADNMSDVTYFADIYQGPKATAPTLRNDSSALVEGDLYWKTTTTKGMQVWSGTQWESSALYPKNRNINQEFIASASQDTFSPEGGYTVDDITVVREGIILGSSEYTAINGVDVILDDPCIINDVVIILSYSSTLNFYTQDESDALHRRVLMRVKASEDLVKGDVVKWSGYNSGENAIEVVKTSAQTARAIGVCHEAFTNGNFGDILVRGLMEGMNTSAWAEGTIMYSSGSGGKSPTQPIYTPYQAIGYIVASHISQGAAMVSVDIPIEVKPITYLDKTTVYTATHNNFIFADTATTGAFTITLPISPATGAKVIIHDNKANFATANLTVGRNGETIMGLAEDMTLSTDNETAEFIYDGSDWRYI